MDAAFGHRRPILSGAMDAAGTSRRTRVLLLFGGTSSEHAISCVTAAGVLRAMDRGRYDVVPVGITKAGLWVLVDDDPEQLSIVEGRLPEVDGGSPEVVLANDPDDPRLLVDGRGSIGVDVVLPLLHGPFGEDGTVQGLLEVAGVRYVGSGVLASAAGMDKHVMKLLLQAAGLPVCPWVRVYAPEVLGFPQRLLDVVRPLGGPVFVKPARAGSSMGISRVEDLVDSAPLAAAVAAAGQHDPWVIVEAAVDGREIECGVLEGLQGGPPETSVCGEILVGGGHTFYDFEAKYLDEASVALAVPAELPAGTSERIAGLATRAFQALGCEGLARADFFLTDGGEVLVNELNTMPGFTPTSMFPLLWAASGTDYPSLITRLIEGALARPTGLR